MYKSLVNRYSTMKYNRCGQSGIELPAISLGLWHNFGSVDVFENARKIIHQAFDKGITHFDLANNYGPIPGSAEETFGKILKADFTGNLRDEMIISTKAGFTMWDGPYGDWGSRKYLLSSLDQSLKRMGIDYVDIFYHHRPDPSTPLEESMRALAHAVQSGKALYVGISNYPWETAKKAFQILQDLGTPCLIHQPKYSLFERWVEAELLEGLQESGVGCIAFSPLAQGMLTDRYLFGIPENSRAANPNGFLKVSDITPSKLEQIKQLDQVAKSRNQSLAQMALSWVLKDPRITSVLIGASSVDQLNNNLDTLDHLSFEPEELSQIENILRLG